MKKLIILITLLASSLSQAGIQPNLISCSDADNTYAISYSSTSLTGDSTLNYSRLLGTRAELNVSAIGTNEVIETNSPFGKVVMAVDLRNSALDSVISYVGLVVPEINMPKNEADVVFSSQIVLLKEFTSIVGPAGVPGALKKSKFIAVDCVAQIVNF